MSVTGIPSERAHLAAPSGPTAAAFVTFGLFWGVWAVALANIQHTFSLTDAQLGILLAVAIAIAGASSAVISHYGEHFGTRHLLAGSLLIWSVLLVCTSVSRLWPVFAAFFVATEVAGGCIDTAMNASASQRLHGRPGALVRFHALFNTGALCGAAASGILLHAGVSWRWLWPGVAVIAIVVAVWTLTAAPEPLILDREMAEDGKGQTPLASTAQQKTGPVTRLRRDGLLVFLLIFALAEITEGGVDTWGVLYLRTDLAAGVLLGAGAYVIGQSVAATTRGVGGPQLGKLSARVALIIGGLVAGGGILLESLTPVAVIAACGLALGAAGASLFWPLVMSEATRRASQPTSAVGAFTAAGYVGWVAGAPVVGWISDSFGAARGLQLLAAMAFIVVGFATFGLKAPDPNPTPRQTD